MNEAVSIANRCYLNLFRKLYIFGSQQTNRHAWYPCCATINVNRWREWSGGGWIRFCEQEEEGKYNSRAFECGSQRTFEGVSHKTRQSTGIHLVSLPIKYYFRLHIHSCSCHRLRNDNKLLVINWLRTAFPATSLTLHRCNLFQEVGREKIVFQRWFMCCIDRWMYVSWKEPETHQQAEVEPTRDRMSPWCYLCEGIFLRTARVFIQGTQVAEGEVKELLWRAETNEPDENNIFLKKKNIPH